MKPIETRSNSVERDQFQWINGNNGVKTTRTGIERGKREIESKWSLEKKRDTQLFEKLQKEKRATRSVRGSARPAETRQRGQRKTKSTKKKPGNNTVRVVWIDFNEGGAVAIAHWPPSSNGRSVPTHHRKRATLTTKQKRRNEKPGKRKSKLGKRVRGWVGPTRTKDVCSSPGHVFRNGPKTR